MSLLQEIISDLQHDDISAVYKLTASSAKSNSLKVGDQVSDGPEDPKIRDAIDELNKLITALEFNTKPEDNNLLNQAIALRDSLKQELHKEMPDTEVLPQPNSGGMAPQIFTNIG